MTTTPNRIRGNLAYLQEESVVIVAVLASVIGYVWLWINMWPITGERLPISSWLGGSVLFVGAVLGYGWRQRRPHLAAYILAFSLLLGTTCAILSFNNPALIYLFILPIVFAGVLLSQRGIFLIAALVGLIVLTVQLSRNSGELMLPLVVLFCLTVTSWLSGRNLHTTLDWFGQAYRSAYQNEQIARQHEAELRLALQSLDEMASRLERANYTLTLERNHAQEARRLKQQFAQTISHELRTPLNIVLAFADLMAQSPEYYGMPLPAPYMRDLSIIHRNAQHLQMLVNDVLDLARIEVAQMTIVPEESNPADLIQDAVQTVRSLVEMHGLSLNVQVAADLPTLWVDTTRIRQVLFNLLNNAARFTESGSITVQVARQAEEVVFSIKDTGAGIAPEDIPRLFVEFQQLDSGTHRTHNGAGLGLAISRRFVELHNGRIWAESTLGQGSTFSFSLPITTERVRIPLETSEWTTTNTIAAPDKDQRTVIVITRSPSAATLLSRYLSGCQTIVVQTFEDARQMIQRVQPQCLVIDTAHDELVAETFQTLAKSWGLHNSPLIACPLPGEDLMRQQLGIDGYLVKPVSAQTIQDILRQFSHEITCILVIDDNHDFTLLLTRLLNRPLHPYKVVSAHSAAEGLALLAYHRPDLIFLDLQLPDVNGIQLIEKIRAQPDSTHIPIVVVTGEDKVERDGILTGKPLMLIRENGVTPGDAIHIIQSALERLSPHSLT